MQLTVRGGFVTSSKSLPSPNAFEIERPGHHDDSISMSILVPSSTLAFTIVPQLVLL